MELLRAILYGVSGQRPSHSLYLAGEQLPLEARLGGLFLGFLAGCLYLAFLGRLRAKRLPTGLPALLGGAAIVVMALDGLNAFFFDGGLPHLYAPATAPRLFTGLAAGYSLALFVLPVALPSAGFADQDEPPVYDVVEFLAGLGVTLVLGALLLLDLPLLLWPAALAMVFSVLVSFTVASLPVAASLLGPARRQPTATLSTAVGLALLALALLAVARTALAAGGAQWGA